MLDAYYECRRHKRTKATTTGFETDLALNITNLRRSVEQHKWTPYGHMCFVVESPKAREVWASPFHDRVVHHVVYNRLRPRFEPYWVATTFACIPGRGTSAAADWAERAARKATCGWSQPAWALQVDIENFFPSIRRETMAAMLAERAGEPWLLHLIDEIVNVDVTRQAHFPGDPTLLNQVPRSKSLWHAPPGRGLPIGNLTSQFAANVYLDPVDQHVTRQRLARHYGRYVDDMLLLDRDPGRLRAALDEIAGKLAELGLRLHPDKVSLKPVSDGIDFCGRFIKPYRSYLRRSTVKRADQTLARLPGNPQARETVTSYLALARPTNTWKLRGSICHRAAQHGLEPDEQRTKVA